MTTEQVNGATLYTFKLDISHRLKTEIPTSQLHPCSPITNEERVRSGQRLSSRAYLSTTLPVLCDGPWRSRRSAGCGTLHGGTRSSGRRLHSRSAHGRRAGLDELINHCTEDNRKISYRCGTVERRTGDRVGCLGLCRIGVNVDGHCMKNQTARSIRKKSGLTARIRRAVSARERHELSGRGGQGTPASDGDLCALGIELLDRSGIVN